MTRLFPPPGETTYRGWRSALWLLGLLVAVKVAMSVNAMLNTADVAGRIDGIPLASFGPEGARTVLLFFALWALGHLLIALTALVALVRYRAFVPLAYLLLLAEQAGRGLIARSNGGLQAGTVPFYVNLGLLALVTVGFALSLLARKDAIATSVR